MRVEERAVQLALGPEVLVDERLRDAGARAREAVTAGGAREQVRFELHEGTHRGWNLRHG